MFVYRIYQWWTNHEVNTFPQVDNSAFSDNVCYSKSKQSGKEKASDAPSWAKEGGKRPNPKQKCQDFAKQLMNEKYGTGWPKGPGTEYNKIVKWCQRSLK